MRADNYLAVALLIAAASGWLAHIAWAAGLRRRRAKRRERFFDQVRDRCPWLD